MKRQSCITGDLVTVAKSGPCDKECRPMADIGFVIDSSGSIGRSNWGRMKRFLKALVSKLDVSPSYTHISAVAYSNNPEVVYRFNNRQATDDVNNAFDGMRWQRGFTYTDKALLLADSDLYRPSNGMRPNVAKVLIVITDGAQTTAKAYTPLPIASAGVKSKGVAVYAIGVGKGVKEAELREIASSQENVFVSASFKELHNLAVEIRKRLCDLPPPLTTPTPLPTPAPCKATADVAFIVDSSGSIGRGRWPLMLNFLKNIISAFNVGPDGTHVAVIAYSNDAKLEIAFDSVSGAQITAEEYGKRIDKIAFQRGFTYIDKGLKMADEQVFVTSAGMRPNVPQVAIVITDGQQTTTKAYTPLDQASKGIKDKGVEVFALGIGSGVDTSQLRQIASSNDNVFTAPGFDELESVVKPIVEKTCPTKPPDPCKTINCSAPYSLGCRVVNDTAECICPDCPDTVSPVCTSDDVQDRSECLMKRQSCITGGLVTVAKSGPCDKECRPIADIGFVIDSSGSIGRSNWGRMKRFLKALVSKLDVSPSFTHISAVAYSNNPEVVYRFNNRQTTDDVNNAFDGMRWQRGFTYTDKALLLADSDLYRPSSGMRPNVAKVLIVITDGAQTTTKAYTPLPIASAGVKSKGVAVYAIGVGKGVNEGELREIASSQENVFVSASFKELHNLAVEIRKRLCDLPPPLTTPTPLPTPAPCKATADVAFIVDSSGSIGRRRWPLMLNFLKNIISAFNVGPDGTHVAVIAYSNDAKLEIAFDSVSGAQITAEEYGKRIDKIAFQRGFTYIDKGLKMADEQVFVTSAGMRPNVPQVAIVITDGQQTTSKAYTPLDQASKGIKDKGVEVFALGIGSGVDTSQLRQIASSNDNVFTAPGFDELESVVKPIVEKTCPTKPPDPCKTIDCSAPYSLGCRVVNDTAECICPDCPDTVSPVCTSDDVQDRSECLMKRQSCITGDLVTVAKSGPCDKECRPIADIGFVIDSSGSIGRSNWGRMKRFLKALVSKLDVSPSYTHISAVAYSNNPEVVYRFNNRQATDDVHNAFDGMRWQRGFTYTDKALLLADSDLYRPSSGMRPNVAKVLIVITDGAQTTTKAYTPLPIASAGLKSKGVAVYAIGVGKGVNEAELREIASSQENVFVSASFKELHNLAVEIRKRLCDLPPPLTTPTPLPTPAPCKATADVAFIVDSSGSIGRRRWPLMLNFLKNIISSFNVGPDGTHVAVIAYSNDAKLEIAFDSVSGAQITAEEYGERIDKIAFQRGFTYIDKGLKMADEQVFVTSAGMRPNVPQVAIVITDGQQTTSKAYTPLDQASKGIKDKGVEVFALGIGSGVDTSQLRQIASSNDNVFTAPGFDELESVVKPIVEKTCPTKPPDPCKTINCSAPYSLGCRVVNDTAECICPDCPDTVSPVCTSDDVQDRSECLMKRQSCITGDLVTVAKSGPCDKECRPIADIGFVIDSSGSIGRSNWGRMKRFLKALVSKLDVSPSFTHISAVAYSNNPDVVYRFNNRQATDDVNNAFDGMRWQRGFTYTDKALLLADSDLYRPSNGMRPNVAKVLIVITDGAQTTTKAYTPLPIASVGVKSKGVAVYAIGVGKGVNEAELREIASSQENVFVSASFKELHNLAVEIRKRLCDLPPTTTTPTPLPTPAPCKATADVAFIVDSSGSIGRRRWPLMLEFLKNIISAFNVGPDGTHVAVIAYSNDAKLEIAFDTLSGAQITAEEYGKRIDKIAFQRGFTYIDKGLKMADEQVFVTSAGMRPGVPKIAIVITDGQQTTTNQFTPLDIASQGIKDKGVKVFALGIGSGVKVEELQKIASSSDDVFTAPGFDELVSVVKPIVEKACPKEPEDPCAAIGCKAPYNIGCRNVNNTAECICPTCPYIDSPVCTSDEVQDMSACFMRRQSCLSGDLVTVAKNGPCEKECTPIADIGFVIDSSGSIGRSNWARMKRFLKSLVSKLDVNPSYTHVSAVAYSNNPEVVYRFNFPQATDDVNNAFDGMRWQRGFTYTDKALLLADNDLYKPSNGMRPNVAKVLIVITDGAQTTTKAYTPLATASAGVKSKGVAVYAIGVGKGANEAELREIASSQENVFVSASFKELHSLAVEIRKRLCDLPPPLTTPTPLPTPAPCKATADVAFIVDSSGSIGRRRWPLMLGFLKNIISAFNVGPDGTHVAVIAYSNDAKLEIAFDSVSRAQITAKEYGKRIDKIAFQRGFTYIDKGLKMADEQVFVTSAGMRPNVPQVAIVITDGQQTTTKAYTPLDQASKGIKDKGVEVFALGIGSGVDTSQLRQIASSNDNVFTSPGFNELESVVKQIVEKTCPTKPPDPCKTINCSAPYSLGCRVVNDTAECICPDCPDTVSPVCTSDDVQDRSECLMKRQSCITGDLVTVAKSGPCEKECRPIADIGFVIDSSGSIGRSNWGRMKRFLKALVSKLDVSPSSTHISAVAYSNNPEVVYRFNNRQATDDVNNVFDGMRWQRGFTYTDKALLLADNDLYKPSNGMRPNVAKVLIVITDGAQTTTKAYTPLAIASAGVKSKGIAVYAIGVGTGANEAELREIASSQENVFVSASFKELHSLAVEIRKRLCDLPPPLTTPTPLPTPAPCKATADVAFIVDSSGSIGRRRWPLMLGFLKNIISAFNVGPDGTHVAVIAYSNDAKLEIAFDSVSGAQITAKEYGKRIDKIAFQRGFTYIDKGLKMADEQVFVTTAGMRPNVPQVAIVITDGQQTTTKAYTPLDQASKGIKDKGVEVFALGIGSGVDTSQLRQIASSNDNVFTSPGFNELESVVKQIVEKTCPTKPSDPCKTINCSAPYSLGCRVVNDTAECICPDCPDTVSPVCTSDDVQDRSECLMKRQSCITGDLVTVAKSGPCEKECRPIADIGFVIDSSGSIGRSNWGRMKRFLKALVSKLDVSPSSTHISAVAYSNNPEVVYRFNNRQATDDVNNVFDSMRWQRGFTYTDKALLLADSDLYNFANGMRPNIAKVLIVITDGAQTTTKAYTPLAIASAGVKSKGIAVYAIGVGKGANEAELREIASSQENVFVSASFKELHSLAVEIRKRLCDLPPPLTTPTPLPTPAPCKATADVAFIVDSSGSIGRRRWPLMLNFLKNIISAFNVGPDGTHVAVIAYSNNAKLEIAFDSVSGAQITAKEYGKRIDKIAFQRGFTYIDKGLKMADEQVFVTSAGMRPNVPQVAIVITDGQQTTTKAYTPLDQASKGIKDKGVEVFALGIGSGVDTSQLRQIASSNDNVFTSPGFNELESVVKQIVEKTCPTKPPDPCKTINCSAPYSLGCRVVNDTAECICPDCPDTVSPVCTSDDVQDRSECLMKRQSCITGDLVTVAKSGPCEKECRPIADIGFVIDSSGSIGRSNWGRMKRFLKALVSKLDVSPSSTHISTVAYSNNPEVVYRFNNRQATDDVNNVFDGMRWQRGFTYTDKALLLADNDLYKPSNGMRPNVAKVLIVITDGAQTTTKAYTPLAIASAGVKSKGIAVYAIGVGKGANEAELREIASSQENVFVSASFKELHSLAVEIRKRLCDLPPPLTTPTPLPTPAPCKATADVAFIVDSSGSIGRRRWPLMLNFLKNIISAFNVGPDGTHVAVIAYSNNAKLEIAFDSVSRAQITAKEYGKRIDKIAFQRGFTYIDKGLKMADEQVFVTNAGMRPNVPQVAIVITDGQQTTTKAYTPLDQASKGIKDKGVEVFALGIGSGVDTSQLRQIASSNDNVFTSPGFNELESVVKQIVEKTCPIPPPLTTPTPLPTPAPCKATADVAFIVDSSGSIGRRRWPLMLNFLKNIISAFNVGPDGTHVAVIAYSNNAKLEIAFDSVSGAQITAKEYGKRIDKIAFQRGFTYIDKGLKMADEQVFVTSAGMRPNVPQVAIVITDGQQTTTKAYTPLDQASKGIKDKGVEVFALGIGSGVDTSQLRQIASSNDNVFTSPGFNELESVVKQIVEKTCPTKPPDPCKTINCSAPYSLGCRVVNDTAECICPDCPDTVSPVCTSDDVQDRSECLMKRQSCITGDLVTVAKSGPCEKECRPIADIGFVIDSSGSIGRSNWGRMKRFLKALVSKLDVSPSSTHISAVAYSNNPEVVYRFNNRQATDDVNNVFDGMRWQRGFTYTDKALLLADSDLYNFANGMRPNVAKVLIVITDGAQTTTKAYTPLAIASAGVKSKGIAVYAIGVGTGANEAELREIASSQENVFVSASFKELHSLAVEIRKRLCDLPPPLTTPTPLPTPAPCKATADVAFIVDSSGSIGRRRWPLMLGFLKNIISAFNVGPDGTHVAVIAYSNDAKLEIAFDSVSGAQITAKEYGKRIDNIAFQRGFTYIDKGLKMADEQVFVTSAGMRPNIPQVAIVITDGQQTTTKAYTPLDQASKGIKDKGVEVFALGIGSGVDTSQLRQIASSNDNVFTSPGFNELESVVKQIVEKTCPIPPPLTTPTPLPTPEPCKATADVAFIVDSSGSIGRRRWPLMLGFLKNIISAFNVGPDGTHVAVIAYSNNAKLEIAFDSVSGAQITAKEYGKRIDKIAFQRGFTYIDKGLKMADEQVFVTSAGMRPSVPQVAIVITDGQQTTTKAYTPLDQASKGIKDKGVEVFALGIGSGVDTSQLRQIASSNDNVFTSPGFNELESVVKQIVEKTCPTSAKDACEIFPCKAPHNIGCRVVDGQSECICPTCPATSSPVCASDDVQDTSECFTKRQACLTSTPISVARRSPCVPECRKAADIAFIVDSSGSIGKTNWERTKRFLKRMVSKLDIGPSTTHVAVITYSTNPETVLRFNTLQGDRLNVAEVNNVLDGLRWQKGRTYIDKALDTAALDIFTTRRGMRSNVPKMAFVITDGKQTKTGSYTPLGLAAKPLRNMGVQMVAIGVGKRNVVDARELLEIAGQDNYVYVIESFEELQNPGQAKIFRQRVCQARLRLGR
nr:uncharacterized protein LOC131798056 isoform X6 [Pocillopora verrucosa]